MRAAECDAENRLIKEKLHLKVCRAVKKVMHQKEAAL